MSKHTTLDQLKMLAQRSKTEIDKVDAKVSTLSNRVDTLVATGGEANVITAIKNNGTALDITDKAVDIGTSIAAAVAASDHLQRKIVTGVDAIDLSAADADKFIYMVPNGGTDDSNQYDEYMVLSGKIEHVGNTRVDMDGKVDKEDGKGLSSNDYTDEDKAKLNGIEMATDAEVNAMLEDVFGEVVEEGFVHEDESEAIETDAVEYEEDTEGEVIEEAP